MAYSINLNFLLTIGNRFRLPIGQKKVTVNETNLHGVQMVY